MTANDMSFVKGADNSRANRIEMYFRRMYNMKAKIIVWAKWDIEDIVKNGRAAWHCLLLCMLCRHTRHHTLQAEGMLPELKHMPFYAVFIW